MNQKQIREQLVSYLEEGHAHVSLENATADVPPAARTKEVDSLPYTLWDLLEHIRIAQWDIVAFSDGPGHTSPAFPDGYWPDDTDEVSDEKWEASRERIQEDKRRMMEMVRDPDRDLTEPFPWGDGQTLLREVQLLIDHRSYHTGQIVVLRRKLGVWDSDHSSFSM